MFKRKFERNWHKKIINSIIAKLGRRDGWAIVLDGPEINTTKTLMKAGWKADKIVVPNNSEDYKDILRYKNKLGFYTARVSLGDIIRATKTQNYGLVYADYMCTWQGNSKSRPEADMKELFRKRLMLDGSVLAITLSTRARKNNGFNHEQITECVSTILNEGFNNGYFITPMPVGGVYHNGGAMYTAVFQVTNNEKFQ